MVNKKILFNRKSVLFKVAIAFILFVMIPFGAGIIYLNINYENQIRMRWKEESELRLISMQDEITNIHTVLNSMLIQIQQDDVFSPHRIRRNSYHTMLAMKQLRRYTATNNILHVLAYVEMPYGRLLSNISSDDLNHFAIRFFNMNDEERYNFWHIIENNNNSAIYEPLMVIHSETIRSNALVYAANLRNTQLFDSPQILIILDSQAIKSRLSGNLPAETSSVLITNQEGKILLIIGNTPEFVSYETVISLHYAEYLAQQYDHVLTHSISPGGWNYYMFLPAADLLQEVRGATRMYGFFGLAFAAASALFFALSYKYNFLPLRRFVRLISQHNLNSSEIIPPNRSEYELIHEGYQTLVNKTDRMQQQLDESYPIRRNYLLHQLIAGGISEENAAEQAKVLMLAFERKHYTVVCFCSANGDDNLPIKDMEAFLQNNLSENKLGYCVEGVLDNFLTILLALPLGEQEAHRLEAVRIQAIITEHYKIHTLACLGRSYPGIGDIRLSFQEAITTVRYRFASDKNSCISFSDTGEDSALSNNYPIKMLQSFYHALEHESPEAVLDRVREIGRLMGSFTITLCRCIYCDLAFGILRYFQSHSPISAISTNLLDDIAQVLETQEMREIKRLMARLENDLLELTGKEEAVNLKDRVRKYIDNHFHQPSLSIVDLADALGMSSGHLSRSYKKESGETLLNYINTKRIEQAKSLLSKTDLPLHEIVREIGYLDVSSFHRKFKSAIGLTPGAYRDKYKQ